MGSFGFRISDFGFGRDHRVADHWSLAYSIPVLVSLCEPNFFQLRHRLKRSVEHRVGKGVLVAEREDVPVVVAQVFVAAGFEIRGDDQAVLTL